MTTRNAPMVDPAAVAIISVPRKVVFSSCHASSLRLCVSGYRHNRAAGLADACAHVFATIRLVSSAKTPMAQNPTSIRRYRKNRPSLLLAGRLLRRWFRGWRVSLVFPLERKCRTNQGNRHVLHDLGVTLHQLRKYLVVCDLSARTA